MIEAVKLWNEPNNKSHWDFEIDPDWKLFARMAMLAGDAVRGENATLTRVLGGMSPIDTAFVRNMQGQGVLDHVDAIAVHGFPLDWNHWQIHEWPDRLAEIQVKSKEARSRWVWGAFRLTGQILEELHALWLTREPRDEYLGTLVNAWLRGGGRARAVRAGEAYVDVGTLHGYREAIQLLERREVMV